MNFTSQICTNEEQSKRLLALGLKKETADCFWLFNTSSITGKTHCRIIVGEFEEDNRCIPAWSLHRLIKIYSKNSITPMVKLDEIDFDWLVDNIAFRIKEHDIYKDYLEK